MSDPTGWSAPKTNWLPADGIAHTDLNRIETNVLGTRDWLKQSGSFEVDTVNLPGAEVRGTIYWEKHAQGLVCLRIPEMLGTSDVGGANINLKLSPVVQWPDDILIAYSGIYVPFLAVHDGPNPIVLPGFVFAARMEIPYEATTDINIYCCVTNDNLFDDNCGIIEQFVSYYTTDSVFGTSTTTSTTPAP